MNKYFKITFLILILCLLCSCGYMSYKDYYGVDDYSKIWELNGFYEEYVSAEKIFPLQLDEKLTKEFFCRYDQQLPLGEGFQIFLEVQYNDEELFKEEKERICNLAFDCEELSNERFSSAYATCTEQEKYLEYALIEEDAMKVYYIYIQNVPLKEIEISKEFWLSNMKPVKAFERITEK